MTAGAGERLGQDHLRRRGAAHAARCVASYLGGLNRIGDLNHSAAEEILLIVAFNVVTLAQPEIPLTSFAIAPDGPSAAIDRANAGASVMATDSQ